MPAVSVIIPAYNGENRYLGQAIESVLAQTYQDREIIVVDDASTDDTEAVVRKFPQARYVRRLHNGGQAAARNEGARIAQGTFLAFLDQDDLWEPTLLEETLPILQADPDAAVVHCDGYQVSEQNDILEYDAAIKHTFSITQILRNGHDVATSGSLFRKHCFEAIGGYDEALFIWEDIDLAIRLSQRFRLLHLPQPLYRHRLYTRNASRDIPSERALQGRKRFLEKHEGACDGNRTLTQALHRDWAQYYSDEGKFHMRMGRHREARTSFLESLRHCPYSHKTLLRLIRSFW